MAEISRREVTRGGAVGVLASLAGCVSVVPFVGDEDEGVHEHGYLLVEIDGEEIHFDGPEYVYEEADEAAWVFHFHADDEPNRWHMHDERLTLADALDAVPNVEYRTEGGDAVLAVEGRTYDEGETATEIEIGMADRDGEIDPERYRLRDGDVITVEVSTNRTSGSAVESAPGCGRSRSRRETDLARPGVGE